MLEEEETRRAKMLRRKLHNMIQELGANTRVFSRVRSLLRSKIAASASIIHGDINIDATQWEEEIQALRISSSIGRSCLGDSSESATEESTRSMILRVVQQIL
jgi:hypothetical protein